MTQIMEVLDRLASLKVGFSFRELRKAVEHLNVSICNGETRWCIISKDWDFVLKIPRLENVSQDYCEIEVKNFERAKAYRVEKLLLPTEFLTENPHGVKIYKQARYDSAAADLDWDTERDMCKELRRVVNLKIMNKIVNNIYDGHRIKDVWLYRVYQLYGKNFLRSFEQWTHDCQVNDLHGGNVGYLHGKPIILDYAGYFG